MTEFSTRPNEFATRPTEFAARPNDFATRPTELPIACTLGAADGPERLRRWQQLAATAAPVAIRAGHRLEVRYRPDPGVHGELQALAVAEAQCCSFVAWTVTDESSDVLLTVAADPARPDDVVPIAQLFGAAA